MNKCFLLNPEKKLAHIRLVVLEKNAKNADLVRGGTYFAKIEIA